MKHGLTQMVEECAAGLSAGTKPGPGGAVNGEAMRVGGAPGAGLLPAKGPRRSASGGGPPEVFSVVIECRDEAEQRTWFERLRAEGVKVRLLVL